MNAESDDSAQRAFDAAVHVVRVDHSSVRDAGRGFVRAVEALGPSGLGPNGVALVRAYDDFARQLAHTFHELEEEIVDRVQVLHAQHRMAPGILARVFPRFVELERQLAAHGQQLDALSAQFSEVPPTLVFPLAVFIEAVRTCLRAHRESLLPALAPFVEGLAHA
ncbi:MAG: hypothetical protein QM817_32325 [Archangium sp.]